MPIPEKLPKPRRWPRLLAIAGISLVGLGFWAVGGAAYWWQRSLPQRQGAVALKGLGSPVNIYRDAHGVPSIFANNRADALRALGYLHASERFFSMEMNRRAGQGRLAEVVGKDMLPTDKFLRTLDLYPLVERSYNHYQPATQALVQAYADGVNAWLETHRDRLPLEFTLLGIKPEPWKPTDSLVWGKLMGLRLSANMREELRRASLLAVQPAAVVERLYPSYPNDAPITTAPRFAPAAPPAKALPKKQSEYEPALEQAFTQLAASWPYQNPGASNEWVVSGARSSTGKPMLANDPHLGLEAPIMWYLARLVTPEDELKGATVPGLPVVLLGQNSHIAWGFTTTNSDVQDLFIETLDPKDPTHYLTPTGSAPFITRQEIIKVKDAPAVTLTVRTTRHGPVISDVDSDAKQALQDSKKVLAFAFTGLRDDDTTPEALLNLNAARNWDEFQNALKLYQSPPQNIVYADRDGHIGFTNPGLVPVRKEGDGRYPADGASGRYDWRGMIPFTYVPRLYDPAGSTILNGNNAVVSVGNAHWLGRDWDTPYRAERIEELLKAQASFTLKEHNTIQMDVLSPVARTLLPRLLQQVSPVPPMKAADKTTEQQAQALLQKWDFTMQADRPEPLIFEWWLMRLYDQLARPPFGALGQEKPYNAFIVQNLLDHPAGWCDKLLQPTSQDCAPQIKAAWQQMLTELTVRYGQDVTRWQWGKEHRAPLENKVMAHLPGFNALFGLDHASNGGFYTVNRGGNSDQTGKEHPLIKTHGSGYRAVYDLANPANSQIMIATGQSGHPLSKHYGDLTPLWNAGQSLTLSGTVEELAKQGAAHLTLTP